MAWFGPGESDSVEVTRSGIRGPDGSTSNRSMAVDHVVTAVDSHGNAGTAQGTTVVAGVARSAFEGDVGVSDTSRSTTSTANLPRSVSRRAFITGITGQDGRHLAELLHEKGYDVYGLVKGQNNPRAQILTDEMPFVIPVSGDLADLSSLVGALEIAQPDEVYNLGAISLRMSRSLLK